MRRIKGWILGILLGVLVLLCLPLPARMRVQSAARDTLLPYQSFGLLLRIQVAERLAHLARAATAVERMREMESEIALLRYRNSELAALERENRWLRGQLDFAEASLRRMVCCRVIARGGSSGWWESIRLNRGTEHGIATGQPAVTSDGLVGRVSMVSAKTCDVLLISDPRSRISCEFDLGDEVVRGARGIVQGAGARPAGKTHLEMLFALDPLRMSYIDMSSGIPPDAKVVTSGLGGVFPRGLPVGTADNVSPVDSGLYLEARVTPAADLSALSYVFVLLEDDV